MIAEQPELATATLQHWCDHPVGTTPLSYVAMLRYDTASGACRDMPGTGQMARLLLRAGAPVDGGPDDSETSLITAASYGDVEVTRVLIDVLVAAGASINHISEAAAAGDMTGWLHSDTLREDRVRALVMAADHERLDVIDRLLDAGTPIDATDPLGRQPLHTAEMNGRVAAVSHLLARGADPDHRDAS